MTNIIIIIIIISTVVIPQFLYWYKKEFGKMKVCVCRNVTWKICKVYSFAHLPPPPPPPTV